MDRGGGRLSSSERSFAHLHVHTEFSMLDGAARIGELVEAAAADGQPALGITDHGNMYGVLDFYEAVRGAGLNPVIGMEGYLVPWPRTERRRKAEEDAHRTHVLLLAETTQGYENLIRIASAAYLDGFFYYPRIDWELLERHHEGLIATSGCLGGLVCQRLEQGDFEGAVEASARFRDIFGPDAFFIELQDHGLPEQRRANPQLIEIARRVGAPLVATNDTHYVRRDDAEAHDALLCVQTGSTRDDPGRFKFDGDQFFLKTAAEMRHLFREVPEACDNTLLVAERAGVEIEFGSPVLPEFPVPDGHTEDSYLRDLVFRGGSERYGEPLPPDVVERLEYELRVIADMGFSGYFLVVWDLIRYARERGIRVGPGRGSAAGCCAAYCLHITELDPIRYDLLFERFLNPGRKQMPDADVDFDERYRGEIIRYAAQRYGEDRVAQIVTFSTIKARAAVRDAARVLGYGYAVGDKIAKAMPALILGRDTPLAACFEKVPGHEDGFARAKELRQLYESDPEVRTVVDVARGLEGLRRQDGIHAAGMVITREPLVDYLPVQRKPVPGGRAEDAPVVTQYEVHGVEKLGLLKIDILGLRNLSVIERTLELIERGTGEQVDIDSVPLDDEATYAMLRRGESVGVFQLEGGPIRSLMRQLAPTTFEDVCALVALYRPGPMAANMHVDYAERKNGRRPVVYDHPDLEEVLADTYGLMIYQEKLMRVAQRLAGYTLEEADNLRKACAKKQRTLIATEREKFVAGCERSGYGRELGEHMFRLIEPFADYAFPKAHAYGYGLIAYQTGYLKANHPVEYLCALLTSVKDDKDKTAVYLNECRGLGIRVTVPDVNASEVEFAPRRAGGSGDGPATITFGLSAVRNVGEGLSALIIEDRAARGPFTDFHEFCRRVDPAVLNKRAVESLVKAGAFDSLGHWRKGLLTVFEQIIDQATQRRREQDAGVMSLFGGDGGAERVGDGFDESVPIPDEQFEKAERLALEKDMLGLYVSDHPLMGAQQALAHHVDATIRQLREMHDGDVRVVGGVVTGKKTRWTKRGELMATFVLEDLDAAVEVMVFPKTMAASGSQLEEDAIVCVKARLDLKEDVPRLVAVEVIRPDLGDGPAREVRLRLNGGKVSNEHIEELKELLRRHRGDVPVVLQVDGNGEPKVVRLGDAYQVDPSNGFYAEARVLLGPDAVA